MMSAIDAHVAKALDGVYRGQRAFFTGGLRTDWHLGLLAHLQRSASHSRAFRDMLIATLAEHTRMHTREFDMDTANPHPQLEVKSRELSEYGFTYFNIPSRAVARIVDALQGEVLKSSRDQLTFGADLSKATATTYRTIRPNILKYPEIVKLASNPLILQVIRNHFRALPRLQYFGASINLAGRVGNVAASTWHIDWSNLTTISLFLYLNDTSRTNGPHAFVIGSHNESHLFDAINKRCMGTPALKQEMLDKNEWTQAEVSTIFPDCEVYHTGASGLAILEDTRGLHRATHPQEGYRMMLTLDWALDHSPIDNIPVPVRFEDLPEEICPSGETLERRFRYIYSGYLG